MSKYFEMDVDQKIMPTAAINLILAETRILSGDTLHAQVVIDSADPDTVVHELYAEIRGIGRSGWVNIHTDKIYETEKEYMNVVVNLCHSIMPLKTGRHQFGFQIVIPDSCPSSYESQFGTIRYTIRVNMVSNLQSATLNEVFPFLVVSRSYFDDVPSAIMRQIEYKDEVDFTVCSLPFGTVYLKIIMPRTGYRLGESIPVKIHVKNSTRKAVKECRIQLILKTQFEAMSRYERINEKKLLEHMMDSKIIGKVKGKTEKDFDLEHLKIPENAVPTQQYNRADEVNILSLSYVMRFSAEPGIETEIPLIVTSKGYKNTIKHGIIEEKMPSTVIRPPNLNRPRRSIVESNAKGISFYC
uniref:Arrestin C-terminal-like domain-containing protein n=1 Tax=Panagrolaimus sp. JU765 TaxID=591449 RepID=A0AC34PWH5_9BILA